MKVAVCAFMVLLASPAFAQSREQLPTQTERTIADVASYATLGASLANDRGRGVLRHPTPPSGHRWRTIADVASYATLGASLAMDAWSCRAAADPKHCYVMTAVRDTVTVGASEVVKRVVHRDRPCAPSCGIDNPSASFWSEHTALSFSTLGQVDIPQLGGQRSGPRLAFVVPLAISTGGLRVLGGKHWISDTLVGAGVGLLTSRIR